MRRASRLPVLVLTLAVAHGGGTAATPPPTAPVPLPPAARLKALEADVGATEPLAQTVALAAPALPDLAGTPDSSPAAGPADALVYVVVFTDFQCPVCRRTVEPLKLLARRHPEDVRLVVKLTASPRHERGADAAAAALAAFRQNAFWPFFDRTFADQRRLGREDLLATAAALGLDTDRFRADMDGEAVREQVRYETALASALGLSATPSFVVNGRVQRGWGSFHGLDAIVARELARARELLAAGTPRAAVSRQATRGSDPADGPRLAAALFGPPR